MAATSCPCKTTGRLVSLGAPAHATAATTVCLDKRRLRRFEGRLDTLRVVEARVANGLVVEGQHVLSDADTSTEALCDGLLPRRLHMDAAENASASLVHCDALHYLGNNVVHVPGLHLVALGNDAVAVNSVALPHHRHTRGLHGLNVRRQHVLDLASAIACDERQPALLLLGIQKRHQLLELLSFHGGSNLATDGVGDTSEVLDMGMVDLPRAVANPEEVGAQVVVLIPNGPCERLFEVKLHCLMRCEELDGRAAYALRPDFPSCGLHCLDLRR